MTQTVWIEAVIDDLMGRGRGPMPVIPDYFETILPAQLEVARIKMEQFIDRKSDTYSRKCDAKSNCRLLILMWRYNRFIEWKDYNTIKHKCSKII